MSIPQCGGPTARSWHSAALAVVVGVVGVFVASSSIIVYHGRGTWLFDAHAYWSTGQPEYVPYAIPPGYADAYLYSPAFAQIIAPITWLPWPAFAAIWVCINVFAFLWLFKPLGWIWTLALMLWCIPELAVGNIYGLLAAATVVALTHRPEAWALPILTKPSLGIGLLWHAGRRQWLSLSRALAATGAIVVISWVLDPQMWRIWIEFLLDQSSQSQDASPYLGWRLLGSVVVVLLAAASDRVWAVPFGLLLALPVMGGISVVTILAAVPRLWLWEGQSPPVGKDDLARDTSPAQ